MNNRHGLPASTEHLYEIVKMDLRTGVLDGSFPPDTRIPSEVELMNRYGVSRITVRHAINELVQEGYLVKRHGTGSFVLPRKHDRHVVSINSFTMDCLASGLTPRTEVLSLGRGRATESAAGFLNIAPGSGVILLDRLRYINDEPVILEENAFPEEMEEILRVEDYSQLCSIAQFLEKNLGIQLVHIDYTIEMAYLSKDQARLLELKPNAPALRVVGLVMDGAQKPVYYSRQTIQGDKVKISGAQKFRRMD